MRGWRAGALQGADRSVRLRVVGSLILAATIFAGLHAVRAEAQTATYHLHQEASSSSGLFQLKSAGPDTGAVTVSSIDLKNQPVNEYLVKAFDTQATVPNASGTIPAGSVINLTLWMDRSANFGTMYPRAKVFLNSAAGAALCTATGMTALTSTATAYSLSCTTGANVAMTTADRFYLWVGVNVTAVAGNHTVKAELKIEGTSGGSYDSQVTVPLPILTPVISGLSLTSGVVGTSVTVSGSNFGSPQGTSTVKFNGVAGAPTTWSATSIAVPVPATATTGSVVVAVSGLASNGVTFTVGPGLTSLSVNSGPVGTSVTLTGSTFGATQGSSTVTFNSVAATPTSWGASSIGVSVPTNASTGPVVVTVNGVASNGLAFTVPAVLTSVSPNTGSVGTAVTISGSLFGASQGASVVTFNGVAATPTSWALTSLSVPVPASAETGPVVVTVGGAPSNGLTFTLVPGIAALFPASGPLGTSVTVVGFNFGATQGTSTVTFNGVATTPTGWNNTAVVAPVPAGVTSGPVVVTVGGVSSAGAAFAVTAAPNISTVTPNTGTVSTAVTIAGANFGATQGISTVTFNGVPATPTSWSATSLAAPVPVGATTGPVVVTVAGLDSNGVPFTVPLSLASLSPNFGAVGTAVTISGSNFGSTQGTSTATFNGIAAAPTSWSATTITTLVPVSATTGPVVVTVGGSASNGLPFTVLAPNVGIQYSYDAAGRLVGVVDLNGDTATYTYDAVGNLLSIARYPSTQVSILSFAPDHGPEGTVVTLSGTGFSTTPSQNTVTVNGTAAAVSSASGTQLVVTVPVGATTGPIAVTTPAGTATSAVSFTVGSSAPTITSFTPVMAAPGAVVTITGTNFDSDPLLDDVAFNVKPATISATSLTTITTVVPIGATSGPLVVATPRGVATSAADFYTPPTGYTTADILVTGRIAAGGSVVTALTTAAKIAVLVFDGTAGRRVSASGTVTSGAFGCWRLRIFQPDGALLGDVMSCSASAFVDTPVLPVSGTYTLVVDPEGASTGTATINLYDFVDVTTPITPNGSTVVAVLGTPGQNTWLPFEGTAGQRISVNVTVPSGSLSCYWYLNLIKPDGTLLGQTYSCNGAALLLEPQTLPVSGTYHVQVDPAGPSTGTANVNLYDVVDVTTPITANGAAVVAALTSPGQNARLPFDGTTGQQVTINVNVTSGNLGCYWYLNLLKPDGSLWNQTYSCNGTPLSLGPLTLPVPGLYTIVIDPAGASTGTASVTLTSTSEPAWLAPTLPLGRSAPTSDKPPAAIFLREWTRR